MAYFKRVLAEAPEQSTDEEVQIKSEGSLGHTERELYEATCREGQPLVSKYLPR